VISLEFREKGAGWNPRKWRDLPEGLERDLARLIAVWAQRLMTEAKQTVAVDTGSLRASINAQLYEKARETVARVGTNKKHGPYVEYGTGLYTTYPGKTKKRITAKLGKALRIPVGRFRSVRAAVTAQPGLAGVDQVGPRSVDAYIFRRSIRGMRARPFMQGLLKRHAGDIERSILLLVSNHANRL